jgi:hypothetical protein
VLGVHFTDRSKTTLRQNLLLGVGFSIGAGIAPLVLSSSLGCVMNGQSAERLNETNMKEESACSFFYFFY